MIANANSMRIPLADNSVDTIITDPPYGLEFMGKDWDHGVPGVVFWREALRVAKPGAMMLAFGGSRTHHRLMCAIEDAGWQIRDVLMWVYGSGFPKSLDISKAIDKHGGKTVGWFGEWLRQWRMKEGITQKEIAKLFPSKTGGLTGCVANWELGFNMPTPTQFSLICKTFNLPFDSIEEAEREVIGKSKTGGAEAWQNGMQNKEDDGNRYTGQTEWDITAPATPEAQQWDGYGSNLKPAYEPIILAMAPLDGTYANNALTWGVAGLNIDGGRIPTDDRLQCQGGISANKNTYGDGWNEYDGKGRQYRQDSTGRWPANLILDDSEQVTALFPQTKSGSIAPHHKRTTGKTKNAYGEREAPPETTHGDSGSAARFFYRAPQDEPTRLIYQAKASRAERNAGLEGMEERMVGMSNGAQIHGEGYDKGQDIGLNRVVAKKNFHPTVKPIALMRYLCKLTATPTGGIVLDPFCGSGSTGCAAVMEGRKFIGFDLDAEYARIAQRRVEHWTIEHLNDMPLFGENNANTNN